MKLASRIELIQRSGPVALIAVLLAIAVSPGRGGEPPPNPLVYVLQAPSHFEEGCFDPCACPILLTEPLEGTLTLQWAQPEGDIKVLDVTSVAWVFPFAGGKAAVSGTGTYRQTSDVTPQQRLELDLTIEGRDPEHYDSGWVPVEKGSPYFGISISRNGFVCYDTAFQIAAEQGDTTPTEETTWGGLKRRY